MGEFIMPSLGSQMIEAKLVKWHVQPGDTVKRGDIIGEIDTEKGAIDIEIFEDGVIDELRIKEGETVPVGAVMAIIGTGKKEADSEMVSPDSGYKKPGDQKILTQSTADKQVQVTDTTKKRISPLARRIAEDLHLDLSIIEGSGPGGSIHKKDVEAAAERQKSIQKTKHEISEEISNGKEKERFVETDRTSPATDSMRKAIAAVMTESNREIPHYYLESDIDMKTAINWLETINSKRSFKERFMVPLLLIKAVANTLDEVPDLNGYWKDNQLQIRETIHIGFTISLRRGGIVTPAILDVDTKNMEQLREEFVDMVMRAREGHLRISEMSSATITLSSLGERGAGKVYGVIYPPQIALIGFGKITEKPWAVNGSIGIRPVMSAVLAGDHRASDGHTGSRFLENLEKQLQNPDDL